VSWKDLKLCLLELTCDSHFQNQSYLLAIAIPKTPGTSGRLGRTRMIQAMMLYLVMESPFSASDCIGFLGA
jgi:hypothetical protein